MTFPGLCLEDNQIADMSQASAIISLSKQMLRQVTTGSALRSPEDKVAAVVLSTCTATSQAFFDMTPAALRYQHHLGTTIRPTVMTSRKNYCIPFFLGLLTRTRKMTCTIIHMKLEFLRSDSTTRSAGI